LTERVHATVVEQFREPAVPQEWHIYSPEAGQMLVKTEARGVCQTDLRAAQGDWPIGRRLPLIPRQNRAGLVTAVGAGFNGVTAGAEVGGDAKRGGFVAHSLVDPIHVAHISEATAMAPITCEGVADYQGIKVTGARPGQWLAVSGVGGLGHLAIRYGKAIGLRVCAVDIDDDKLAEAQRLGADATVNAKNGDPVAAVWKATDGGAQSVLIAAPSLDAFRQGVAMIRTRGTCVLVGLPPGEFPLTLFDVVASCITVRSSFVGTRQDMAEALGLALDRRVRADIEVQPLSAINGVFERLQRGNMASRVVLELGPE